MAATFARFLRIRSFYKDFRVQEIAIPLSATGGVDRTNSCTHIFLCLVASCMSEHILPSDAHASGSRCSQELCCPSLRTQKKSSHIIACFTEHSSAYFTLAHHFVPRLQRQHPLNDRWRESLVRFVPLRWKERSLATWLNHFLIQVMTSSPASRMTLPPQSQPPRSSMVFISKRQWLAACTSTRSKPTAQRRHVVPHCETSAR